MRFHKFPQEKGKTIAIDLDRIYAVRQEGENRAWVFYGTDSADQVIGRFDDILALISPPAAPDFYEADLAGFGAAAARPVKASHKLWNGMMPTSEKWKLLMARRAPPTLEEQEFIANPTKENFERFKAATAARHQRNDQRNDRRNDERDVHQGTGTGIGIGIEEDLAASHDAIGEGISAAVRRHSNVLTLRPEEPANPVPTSDEDLAATFKAHRTKIDAEVKAARLDELNRTVFELIGKSPNFHPLWVRDYVAKRRAEIREGKG